MPPITESQPRYDLLSPQFFADPHPVFRRMREQDPVYWHPVLNMWILVRYADIQSFMRDARFTAVRTDQYARDAPPDVQAKREVVNQFLSRMLVFHDAPTHTRLRSLINKAFLSKAIEALRPFVQQVVDSRIDEARSRGTMEVVEQLARPLPASVIARMLGMSGTDFPRFKAWGEDVVAMLGAPVGTAATVEGAHRAVVGLKAFMRDAIAERRTRPSEDVLSLLIHAEDQGQVLDDEELVATSAFILLAGYETTTHLISNGLLALLEHPDQLRRLRDQPELATGAVEEVLRYDSAVFQVVRRAREPVEIGGHVIQAGALVLGLVHAANRDPAQFADPERFDITRSDNNHLGFGYGPHFCVGAPIARLETGIALTTLVQRLPGLALATTSIERLPNLAIRGMRALPVTFTP